MRRTLLIVGLTLAGMLPPTADAQDLDLVRHGVVKVVSKRPGQAPDTATGFIVRTETKAAFVVTASHVVEGADEVGVEFFGERRLYPARVLGMEGADPDGLAALIVEGDVPADVIILGINRDLDVKAGEPVTMIGFPSRVGVPWAVTRGNIVGRRGKVIVFTGAVEKGNSGGPLLKGDQVIGVITREQGPSAFASPGLVAQYALEGWGVRFGVRLRSTPVTLHGSELLRLVKAKGFNHPAPEVERDQRTGPVEMESIFGSFRHEYESKTLNGDRVVIDHATSLMWRWASSEVLETPNRRPFLARLNGARYAGFADWRLPTIEELASLMEARSVKQGENPSFIDPEFGERYACISADSAQIRNERYELRVNFFVGGFSTIPYALGYVCAVRSLGPGELRPTAPSAK